MIQVKHLENLSSLGFIGVTLSINDKSLLIKLLTVLRYTRNVIHSESANSCPRFE